MSTAAILHSLNAPGCFVCGHVHTHAAKSALLLLLPTHCHIFFIPGRRSFVSDITTAQCRQLIKREAAGSLFDVVVHDGAPNVGGAWTSEAYTQVCVPASALHTPSTICLCSSRCLHALRCTGLESCGIRPNTIAGAVAAAVAAAVVCFGG